MGCFWWRAETILLNGGHKYNNHKTQFKIFLKLGLMVLSAMHYQ